MEIVVFISGDAISETFVLSYHEERLGS